MTRYECSECGTTMDLLDTTGSDRMEPCPVCDEQTRWTLAFAGEGVSY